MNTLVTALALIFGCVAFYRGVFRPDIPAGNRMAKGVLLLAIVLLAFASYPVVVKAPFAAITFSGYALGIIGIAAMLFHRPAADTQQNRVAFMPLAIWGFLIGAGMLIPAVSPGILRADWVGGGGLLFAVFCAGFGIIQLVRGATHPSAHGSANHGSAPTFFSIGLFGLLGLFGVILARQSFAARQSLSASAAVAFLLLVVSVLGIAQACRQVTLGSEPESASAK